MNFWSELRSGSRLILFCRHQEELTIHLMAIKLSAHVRLFLTTEDLYLSDYLLFGGHLLYFPSTHAICAGHGIPSFSFLHRERVRRNNRASVVQRGLLWLYCSLWYYSGSFTVSVGALPGAVFLRHPNWYRATKEKTLCEQPLNHLRSVVTAFITLDSWDSCHYSLHYPKPPGMML